MHVDKAIKDKKQSKKTLLKYSNSLIDFQDETLNRGAFVTFNKH